MAKAIYWNEYSSMKKKGKSDFEKDFFKLMNNGLYRNTMENVRKRDISNLWQLKQEGII